MVITIGRENGSGGRYIGEELSRRLGIKLYDKELQKRAAEEYKVDMRTVEENDEVSKESYMEGKMIFTKKIAGHSLDEKIFALQSKIIRELAKKEDCIIIGRCGNYILRDEDTADVFVYASDEAFKVKRKMVFDGLNEKEARETIAKTDEKRARYYKYHTKGIWSSKEEYDLCIDTSKVGVDTAIDLIELYYKSRKGVK